ncbi:centrosomal AT-AC splicing factor [Ambystoma mexicanum]|uniref:centrosomal AT-AC splicing factor n=1 Tax=Ambystoma mexicanum TaxID=8296 RepID=UPI0037E816A9
MGVHYCSVCRQTSFSGRGHAYSKKHQQRVKELLASFLLKVEAARKMVKGARVLKYDATEHEKNIWCYCCQLEVKKHMGNGSMTVIHGSLLEHLASPEHKKETNKFWWENKADAKLKPQFLLSPEDYEKFKSSVLKALESYEETEDVLTKEMAAQIREVEQSRQEMIQYLLEPQPETDPCEGASVSCTPAGALRIPSNTEAEESRFRSMATAGEELEWMETAQNLTFVGHQEMSEKGNIYSGATPPWLIRDEEPGDEPEEIGPSFEEFLKQQEKEKLKKLPPNRVGANFDHTSETHEGWLPSFGRVWNNGRRWQSRHQYRAEGKATGSRKRKPGPGWKSSKKRKTNDT